MKKIIISLLIVLSVKGSMACDICGCGVGSYYTGILPEFNKKIFGLRYRHNSLQTHIGSGGVTSYLTTDEIFRTTELWGGWTISKKLRLTGYIPFSFNEKLNQGITHKKSGLGDIGLQAFYQLFDKRNAHEKSFISHSLWAGAGIKLPTGKYDEAEKDDSQQSANIFQLGTASTDFTVNLYYDLRIQDFGINTSASYKINSNNNSGYRYGNKLNTSLQAYYKILAAKKVRIAPNVGVSWETAAKDIDNKFSVDVSGGNILLQTLGAEISFGKIAIGGNWQRPLSQKLANGFVKANDRTMVHLSFML